MRARPARRGIEEQTYDLNLSFGELTLIYKSLHAVKRLGALPPHDFGGRLRNLLKDVPMLHDLSVVVQAEDVHPAMFHVL